VLCCLLLRRVVWLLLEEVSNLGRLAGGGACIRFCYSDQIAFRQKRGENGLSVQFLLPHRPARPALEIRHFSHGCEQLDPQNPSEDSRAPSMQPNPISACTRHCASATCTAAPYPASTACPEVTELLPCQQGKALPDSAAAGSCWQWELKCRSSDWCTGTSMAGQAGHPCVSDYR
jgi:hypothetical protein